MSKQNSHNYLRLNYNLWAQLPTRRKLNHEVMRHHLLYGTKKTETPPQKERELTITTPLAQPKEIEETLFPKTQEQEKPEPIARERVFTPELDKLASQVISHTHESQTKTIIPSTDATTSSSRLKFERHARERNSTDATTSSSRLNREIEDFIVENQDLYQKTQSKQVTNIQQKLSEELLKATETTIDESINSTLEENQITESFQKVSQEKPKSSPPSPSYETLDKNIQTSPNPKEETPSQKAELGYDFFDNTPEMPPPKKQIEASQQKKEEYLTPTISKKPEAKAKIFPEEELLAELYTQKILKEETFHKMQNKVMQHFQADAIALLMYDKYQQLYRILNHNELHGIETKHLFFSIKDKLLQKSLGLEHKRAAILQTTQLREDASFEKRLGKALLDKYAEIHTILLKKNDHTQNLVFLLLFHKKNSSPLSITNDLTETKNQNHLSLIEEALPLYQRLQNRLWYKHTKAKELGQTNANVYTAIQELAATQSFHALHLLIKEHLQISNWTKQFDRFLKLLEKELMGPREKIIVENPHRLFFLLQNTDPNTIINFVKEHSKNLEVEVYAFLKKYPEDGANLFNYMIPEVSS